MRSITATAAVLSWKVSPEMEQIPHRFLFCYDNEGTEPQSISTELCSADITDLKPGTEYTVRVYTELQHGGKSQPASLQMRTGKLYCVILIIVSVGNVYCVRQKYW